jgi:hypothetical protein
VKKLNEIYVEERIFRIIRQLEERTGQSTSDVITKAISEYVKNLTESLMDGLPEQNGTQQIPSNAERESNTIPNKMLEDEEIVLAESHNDHSYITKGLVHMMQNKIFPVILVIDELKKIQNSADKNDWISLDWFKERAVKRATDFAQQLQGRSVESFQTGLPPNENKIGRSMKPGWSQQRRRDERGELIRNGQKRFITNFVGEVYSLKSVERDTLQGAPGAWGLIEVKISKSAGPTGAEWVRLTEKGKEFTKMFVLPTVQLNFKSEDLFTIKNVQWLIKRIFDAYPLEHRAMMMMLKNVKFGDSNKEEKGSEVLAKEFYKLQKKYLEELMENEKDLEKKDDYKKAIEGLKGKNVFTKTKKGRKEKFVEYYIPKMRANAVMNRLQEMGLFVLKDRLFYERTEFGKNVLEKYR